MRGFTLIELVAVLVVTALLGAVAVPRLFGRHEFEARVHFDAAKRLIRQARRIAVAGNRTVWLEVTPGRLAACRSLPCGTRLSDAGTAGNCAPDPARLCETAPAGAFWSGSSFAFDSAGRPFGAAAPSPTLVLDADGRRREIRVEAETGHVR